MMPLCLRTLLIEKQCVCEVDEEKRQSLLLVQGNRSMVDYVFWYGMYVKQLIS